MSGMYQVGTSLHERFRKGMKNFVEELKDRDDYEARLNPMKCYLCEGNAQRMEYKIHGETDWKPCNDNEMLICPACEDKKMFQMYSEQGQENLKEQLRERFEEQYLYIPEDLKNAGFKNFKINTGDNVLAAKREAMNYAKVFAELEENERYNLVFMGNCGSGKTHLSTAIVRTLREQGFLVGLITTGNLLTKIKGTYNKGASQTEEGILKDIRKFDLLVLDDLGSESKSNSEFEWSKTKLFEIVNERIGKPTIYTSNFNESTLPTAIGERVYSRLNKNTKFIELVADDYRKNYRVV